MSISFRHRDVTHEGDPVLIHATLERPPGSSRGLRKTVEPFIGEVREMATAGRYFYVRAHGRLHGVPWDGFSILGEGWG